jgi:PST family polysaccharide transporter
VTRATTEIVYSLFSVGLAWAGFGGMAIVYGNIARYFLYALMLIRAADRRDWLTPSPLRWTILKPVFAFGLPLWLGALATFASRRWDNLVVSAIFGVGVVGQYNLAYNLADIPAIQVGEQIGEVLLPSFANMSAEQRKDAIVRSTGLLALIIFPLAIGLGAIAHTVVRTLLDPSWAGVAPMLVVLSALSVVRPFGFTIASYLQASNRPRLVMMLNVAKVILLVPCIAGLGLLGGPLWACAGVGVAFAFQSIASMAVVARQDGVKMSAFLMKCLLPLLACGPMVAVVLATRWGLAQARIDVRGLNLVVEMIAGGLAYVVAAPVIARSTSRELLDLVRAAIRKRRGGGSRPSDPPPSEKTPPSVPGLAERKEEVAQ